MKKLNLLISTLFLGLLISLSTGEVAFAKVKTSDSVVLKEKQGNLKITSIYYPQPIEYDFHDEAIISPMYIPYTGDEYEIATKTLYKSKNWGTVVTNNSSLNDSVTRTFQGQNLQMEVHQEILFTTVMVWQLVLDFPIPAKKNLLLHQINQDDH